MKLFERIRHFGNLKATRGAFSVVLFSDHDSIALAILDRQGFLLSQTIFYDDAHASRMIKTFLTDSGISESEFVKGV